MLIVTGCSAFVPLEEEPVTIRFVAPGTPESFEPLVAAFEAEHEAIKVALVTDPISGLEDLMAADVSFAYQIWLPEMIERGYPISLNALIAEDEAFSLDDLYPATVEALSVQGRVWALPYVAEMLVMSYNRDLFDRYDVPYPEAGWSWDDFLARAQRLTHPEDDVYGYAMAPADGDLGAIEGLLWMAQAGGGIYDDMTAPTELAFTTPRTVAALAWYSDLIYRYEVTPRPEVRQAPYPSDGINDARLAMWISSLSEARETLDVGRVALPQGEAAVTFGTVVGLIISAEAEDPRACWEFVSFLSEKAPPALMPARRALVEAGATGTLSPEAVAAARASMPHLKAFMPSSQGQLDTDFETVLQTLAGALARIQDGEPVQTVLAEVQVSLAP